MKVSIDRPEWRKTAGQLLSSDIETKVNRLVKKSQETEIQDWTVGKTNRP